MAKTTPDLPAYADLKARAKELGINHVGVKGPALYDRISAAEAKIAGKTADKGEQATADAVAAANETPTGQPPGANAGDLPVHAGDATTAHEPAEATAIAQKAASAQDHDADEPALRRRRAKADANEPDSPIPTLETVMGAGYSEDAARQIIAREEEKAGLRSARNGTPVKILRQNEITWWCPIDGFSMPQYMQGCAQCGARRDGDKVIPTRD